MATAAPLEIRDPHLPPDDPSDPSLFAFTDAGRRLWGALFAMPRDSALDDYVRVRCGDLHAAVATLDAVERGVHRRSDGTAVMPARDPAIGAAVIQSTRRLGWFATTADALRSRLQRVKR